VSIFAVVERVILNPPPYPDSDRLVQVDHGAERLNIPYRIGLTSGLYYHYSERSRTLESVAMYRTDHATLSGDGDPERIQVARATASLASVLRVHPVLGRWFSEQEGVPGTPQVAVLSHSLWSRRYGSDPDILGRWALVNGTPTQVIGILSPSFAFLDARALAFLDAGVDMWLPAQITRTMGFGLWSYAGVARLRDGSTLAEARRELTGLLPDVTHAFPGLRLSPCSQSAGVRLSPLLKPARRIRSRRLNSRAAVVSYSGESRRRSSSDRNERTPNLG
jgi:hypothetical protein